MRFLTTLLVASLATPAFAAAYQAAPVAKPDVKVVACDVFWRCDDSQCRAKDPDSRPATVCAQLVKKVGRLNSFTVSGTAFGAAALEKCNASAR